MQRYFLLIAHGPEDAGCQALHRGNDAIGIKKLGDRLVTHFFIMDNLRMRKAQSRDSARQYQAAALLSSYPYSQDA